LRELIEAKMKGQPMKPKAVSEPPPVIYLMAALKRSLARRGRALLLRMIVGETAGLEGRRAVMRVLIRSDHPNRSTSR
jgi:hypothetical protein